MQDAGYKIQDAMIHDAGMCTKNLAPPRLKKIPGQALGAFGDDGREHLLIVMRPSLNAMMKLFSDDLYYFRDGKEISIREFRLQVKLFPRPILYECRRLRKGAELSVFFLI